MTLNKTSLIVAVLAAFAAHGAFAADDKTRAEVKAEGKAAAKKGNTECEASAAPAAKSDKTRAEVKAAGKGTSRECDASVAPAAKSEKSRAEVKQEVKEAVKSGELSKSDAMEKAKK